MIKDIELQKQSVLIKNGDSLQCYIDNIKQSYFYGNASRVSQMISILVDNAVKFTENGVINIGVNVVSEGADYQ